MENKNFKAVVAYAKTIDYRLARDNLGNMAKDLYGKPYFTNNINEVDFEFMESSWQKYVKEEKNKEIEQRKLSKEKPQKIGNCIHCGKPVYHNKKYEVMEYEVSGMITSVLGNSYFTSGIVHKPCEVQALKHLIASLKKDIITLHWLIERRAEMRQEFKNERLLDRQKKELERVKNDTNGNGNKKQ